jgi:tryptophanyl-tRNA synthetase
MTTKKIIFSGIQPSGKLNISHYIGAIKNWIKLQKDFDCIFCLVDLHAITVKQDPEKLKEHCYEHLALYIACGIDPEKNLIFIQSHVPAHTQLAWILNCFTYMGELNRMTQFKDKAKQHDTNINVGLFDYPVLQAADILLYNTNLVPVGHDQTQHIELTRDIAIRFNNLYGDVFTIPEICPPAIGGRIMSLQDPMKKMSKSDPNENAYINLLDTTEAIRDKMKRAVTDSEKEVFFAESKPGISNLLTLFSAVTNQSIQQLENHYRNLGYGKFKQDIAEAMIEFLTPIQKHYHELRNDKTALQKILHHGAEGARDRANQKLKKVQEVIGLIKDITQC